MTLDHLIACPNCDLLHRDAPVEPGRLARCQRCGTVLFEPRRQAMTRVTMLATASLVLLVVAVTFPFLDLSASGFQQQSSVIDAVRAFTGSETAILSLALAFLIVLLPMLRLLALLYTLAPMALGHRPYPRAAHAFRLAETIRPWAMAEIFIIGVAVALVKVAGLATVTIGPAFWALVLVVLIGVVKDNMICRFSVWKTLQTRA